MQHSSQYHVLIVIVWLPDQSDIIFCQNKAIVHKLHELIHLLFVVVKSLYNPDKADIPSNPEKATTPDKAIIDLRRMTNPTAANLRELTSLATQARVINEI